MDVPLIDCDQETRSDADIARDIDAALKDVGFMALTNLGLSSEDREAIFSASRRFFASPREQKMRCAYRAASENFGYQGLLEESLDPTRPADLKETFTMRNPVKGQIDNDRWPDQEFRAAAEQFYRQAMRAAERLQRLLALALQMPTDYFVERHGGENITLRLLHYPPVATESVDVEQMGAGAHTDYGMLTLLLQDDVGGLQVQSADGAWHPAPPRDDAIVINCGDMLERWSNGRYRSTPHRVLPVAGSRERYSVALFLDPDSATPIEALPSCTSADDPPRFAPTTAGQHLQERIEATHLA